tara:strand:+ start:53 stop:361 length:309 start_codon:yes stop_codon:yes gene_type:complete
MTTLRWTNNEPYEKTPRRTIQRAKTEEEEINIEQQIVNESESIQKEDMLSSNKKESTLDKMGQREWISQSNRNPFMSKNNYVDDLQVQEDFLKPQNSNFRGN